MNFNKEKWLALQSLDNQIVTYGIADRIKANHKKTFTGHIIAGYAVKPSFSPDAKYITSGDSTGHLWFWDWKTTRVFKKFKAHDSVVMNCEWLPHETSKVVTGSWDSTLK